MDFLNNYYVFVCITVLTFASMLMFLLMNINFARTHKYKEEGKSRLLFLSRHCVVFSAILTAIMVITLLTHDYCPNCHTMYSGNVNYCKTCEENFNTKNTKLKCSKCGNEYNISATINYCPKCGNELKK